MYSGHTHEDVDQMFSRFSVAMRYADIRLVEDLLDLIKGSYHPRPHVEELRETLDFDTLLHVVAKGRYPGIVGRQGAPQSEKPHCFRIKMFDGRATLHMKFLSTDKGFYPSKGVKLLWSQRWDWPMEIMNKQHNPLPNATIDNYHTTLLLLEDECRGPDSEAMGKW